MVIKLFIPGPGCSILIFETPTMWMSNDQTNHLHFSFFSFLPTFLSLSLCSTIEKTLSALSTKAYTEFFIPANTFGIPNNFLCSLGTPFPIILFLFYEYTIFIFL